ncbi:MAG: amino acid permease [Alphaproteobacteria bacterium]|nr:amino acid permease [Alphaproteobacteria bacterium]
MGNMIGSGVFLLPASLARYGWDAVAGWIVTIGGALAIATVLATLTRALPDAKGPIEMVGAAFGPLAGTMIGWSYWVSIWTANVTIAVAAVSYLSLFLPIIGTMPGLAAFCAFLLLWALTLLNLGGARMAGWFQVVTLILKLIPLVVVAGIIFLLLGKSGGAALAPFPKEGLSAGGITASAALTLWALLGFESASVACDKVDRPGITIPRATMLGTLLTGIIYLIVCSGIALMLPMEIAASSNAPFADFVARYWAQGPAYFIGLFAAISAIGALNGWILLQGELPLSMARSGMLPQWLAATNASGTPVRAFIVASILASLLLLANSLRSMADLFVFMALVSTSAALWLYLACAASALRLKVALPVATLGLAYALWTLWGAGWQASGLSLGLMLTGLPIYWWVKRTS